MYVDSLVLLATTIAVDARKVLDSRSFLFPYCVRIKIFNASPSIDGARLSELQLAAVKLTNPNYAVSDD